MKISSPLSSRGDHIALLAFLILVAILVIHALHRMPFLADDALISLRYTQRLLAGDGLTWTAGERVEGYSNLLWVLLAAIPGFLGMDLVIGLRMLGLLSCAAVVAALIWPRRKRWLPWSIAALFFVLAGPVSVWSIGGLEAPLLAALLAWSISGAMRMASEDHPDRPWRTALPLGLMALTRPDGILLSATVVLGVFIAHLLQRNRSFLSNTELVLRMFAPAVFLLGAQLIFRRLYYHDWLPNTAYAKLGFSEQRLAEGWAHVGQGLLDIWPLALLGSAGLLLAASRGSMRLRIWPVVIPTIIWLLYLAAIGGDVFPAYRHLLPVTVSLAFAVGLGLETPTGLRWRQPTMAGALLVALGFGIWQWNHAEYRKATDNDFVGWGKDIALTLQTAFADRDPLLAVSAAGCLPYYSEFRSIDILGLCDRHIAHNRPTDFGSGPLAHELGDAAYVLDRQPDILMIGPPAPGGGRELAGRYDRELLADPRFRDEYRSIQLQVQGNDGRQAFSYYAWLRVASATLGRRESSGQTTVPAYFCNGNPESYSRLDSRGKLVMGIDRQTPAYLRLEEDPARIAGFSIVPADPSISAEIFTDSQDVTWLGLTCDHPVLVEQIMLQRK